MGFQKTDLCLKIKKGLLKILFGRCELRSFLFGTSSCLWHFFPCGSIFCLTLADCERSSSKVSLPLYPLSILYLFSSSLLWNALESSSFVGLSSIAQKSVSHQSLDVWTFGLFIENHALLIYWYHIRRNLRPRPPTPCRFIDLHRKVSQRGSSFR